MTMIAPVGTRRASDPLVAACQQGDHSAMERLYQRHIGRVHSVVCRMVGHQDAEEVVQETFIKIFKGIDRFRGDASIGTWIYRLTVNSSLTYLSRRKRHNDRIRVAGQLQDVADTPPVSGGALDRIQLERAIAQLPSGYRAVLVLHDVEGLSHEEIANIMGWHRGTSKSQLHKARARMRRLLSGEQEQR